MLQEKKLVGKRLTMSLANDRTPELWRSFMMQRKEIQNCCSSDLYSIQIYDPKFNHKDLTLHTVFDKLAAAEVTDIFHIPEGMEAYTVRGGLYAVYIHKGLPSAFEKTFHYIFQEWMPASEYEVDSREHFELLGEKYKNNHPDSEEEIWIPIRQKH